MKKSLLVQLIIAVWALAVCAQTWTDISSALVQSQGMTFPGGVTNCSGVCVNRLTGDVVVKFIDNGMWKSTDKGTTWARIDNKTVSGRCESGWGVQVDQDNPTRMAIFSLDGTSGYTPDGITWKSVNASPAAGRGFDFGSVDWATTDAKVMIASAHESNGQIVLSTDGGTTWASLSVTFNGTNPGSGTISMVGALDATTLIYSSGSGINRSTNLGASWQQVSTANPQTRTVVRFNGKFYLGTASGLLASTDNGATWQTRSGSVSICQGPFFGADENTMVVAGPLGVYKTTNAGTSWTKITGLTPPYNGNTFDPTWFGCYSWDPVNNCIYATRMVCPAYKYQVPATGVINRSNSLSETRMNAGARSSCLVADHLWPNVSGRSSVDVYNVNGRLLCRAMVDKNGSVKLDRSIFGQQMVLLR